jgi:hypothetical protein
VDHLFGLLVEFFQQLGAKLPLDTQLDCILDLLKAKHRHFTAAMAIQG